MSYSVGQVTYITNTGTDGVMAQGLQQSWEIFVVTGVEEATGIILSCSVYPNPVSDYLFIKVRNIEKGNLSYQLLDMNERLLINQKLADAETTIDMHNFTAAAYILKVIQNSKVVKIFKIIKNQ